MRGSARIAYFGFDFQAFVSQPDALRDEVKSIYFVQKLIAWEDIVCICVGI